MSEPVQYGISNYLVLSGKLLEELIKSNTCFSYW